MPKVGKHDYNINGAHIVVDLWFTQSSGFEYRTNSLPGDLGSLTGVSLAGYSSEGALRSAVGKALVDWSQSKKTERKVIFYKLEFSDGLICSWIPSEMGHYIETPELFKAHRGNSFGGPRTKKTFGFDWSIMVEYNDPLSRTRYRSTDEKGNPIGHPNDKSIDMKVLDWTQEREDFFRSMETNLFKLASSVAQFFSNPEMLQLIDSRSVKAIGQ